MSYDGNSCCNPEEKGEVMTEASNTALSERDFTIVLSCPGAVNREWLEARTIAMDEALDALTCNDGLLGASASADFRGNGFVIDFTASEALFDEVYDLVVSTIERVGRLELVRESQVLSSDIAPCADESVAHEAAIA